MVDTKKESSLTCSVCLELFCEPKILPCCHTFCLKCLGKRARYSGSSKVPRGLSVKPVTRSACETGEITCPQCRKTHVIPEGGLSSFLTDFIASHEVEVKLLKSPPATGAKGSYKVLTCGECDKGSTESYCCDCQHYLCHDCLRVHEKFKSFRGHKAIPIQDLDAATLQSSQTQYCSKHKGEILKLYCNTCQKLLCRDCVLVDHRLHQYVFAEDARKQIEGEITTLRSTMLIKLKAYRINLAEIEKVERVATGYLEVLKININVFFDKLVQSIEARRSQLLKEAEIECEKDLKQIWADKTFHQTTISQISSVFDLIQKARKCTSDVEMLLTSLQGIQQLMQLSKVQWDGDTFARIVSSPTIFGHGKEVVASDVGQLKRASVKEKDLEVLGIPPNPEKGSTLHLVVKGIATKGLVDKRSGTPVCLSGFPVGDLEVVVRYRNLQKELAAKYVHVSKTRDGEYAVNIRLAYHGNYSLTFRVGKKEFTNHTSFSVCQATVRRNVSVMQYIQDHYDDNYYDDDYY